MALYMNLMKLSAAGAKAVRSEGLAARIANADKTLGAIGGKCLCYYALADGDYDLMAVMDIPDLPNAAAVRASLLLKESGAFDQVRLYRLASADEVDGGETALETTYRAPGSR